MGSGIAWCSLTQPRLGKYTVREKEPLQVLQRCSWNSVVLVCVTLVPFLLFKGAKWKTPFFGCLFSLLMRRHLEILLRFQPIPLASFNFRRGLVVYLGGFVCFFMYLYNDTLLPCRHYPCPWAGGSCWGYPKLGCCVCLHKSQLTDTVGALGSLFSAG